MDQNRRARPSLSAVGSAACLAILVVSCGEAPPPPDEGGAPPFTLGLLMDYSGALGKLGAPGEKGVRLAVQQVNAAGGVLGRAVEIATADGATDPETSIAAARRLIEEEGAHAIIGPFGSTSTLAVARNVTVDAGVPLLSPTATAPAVTDPEHAGMVFRGSVSDVVQGPALAQLTQDQGFHRVAVLYRPDSYGTGLKASFVKAFSGEITAEVAIDPVAESHLESLREAATGRPDALVAITFAPEAEVYLSEALDHGLFERFVFSDALAHQYLLDSVGAERLAGNRGTLPRATPPTDDEPLARFTEAFVAVHGEAPPGESERATYDLALCLCLAAEQAGSTAGVALRDALHEVCGGSGEVHHGGSAVSVGAALAAVRGGTDVNYEGLAGSLDWNVDGDITNGTITIWEIRDGTFQQLEDIAVDLEGTKVAIQEGSK